jgi:methyl-accepting chemotaxis protein
MLIKDIFRGIVMGFIRLSQKKKMVWFIAVLCLGFVSVGIFTAKRLASMVEQFEMSSHVTEGAKTLYATQAYLLSLAANRSHVKIGDIDSVGKQLDELAAKVDQDVSFLKSMGLTTQADTLLSANTEFEQTMHPWLKTKSELGFSVDEGQLGLLKSLASTIEAKIEETGMVTINSDFQVLIKAQQNYLLAPNEKNLKLFNRAMAGFVNMSKSYSMLNLYEKELDTFKKTFVRVGELSQQAALLEAQLGDAESQAQHIIQTISTDLTSMSKEYQSNARDEASGTTWSLLVAFVILAVITISLSATISLSMTKSLAQTKKVLDSLSHGDLSKRLLITKNHNDEFNQLAVSINGSCEHLGKLVQGVQKNSEALSGDAADLNHGLDVLVKAQMDVIRQTDLLASATEQVSGTTMKVSDSLEAVAEISQSSTIASQEGAEVISAAIQSLEDVGKILTSAASHIQRLEEASEKVDSVMDIINGIAEQTNLLALNAAIEAARAGEQGRGFAVVADEVRNLAVRTVDAVSDISGTIETMKKESAEVIQYIGQSEDTMKRGQERGMQAMDALSHITDKAAQTAEKTNIISHSIKELASTSQSMAESMVNISQSLKQLEQNNEKLRDTSRVVDERSTGLSADCLRFTV